MTERKRKDYRPSKEEVRKWRRDRGLTQTAAGEMIGVGRFAWGKYENGTRVMPAFSWKCLNTPAITGE